MKILYLSCHSVLESLEVQMLHDIGHEVFSLGAYSNPNAATDDMRPKLKDVTFYEDLYKEWRSYCDQYPELDIRNFLSKFKSFVNKFDIIIVMHIPEWVEEAIKCVQGNPNKRVIWRTIGQSVASLEQRMQASKAKGLEIIRYSPRETNIPHFAGQDGLIRFYKDPEVYKGWTGNKKQVITFAQSMQQRGPACNFDIFEKATRPFVRSLFGPQNEHHSFGTGKVTFERQIKELQQNRVYFYTGTHPASYTLNFMEAWMMGVPIVAIGPHHGNADYLRDHDLYEVHQLIQNEKTGLVSDNIQELQNYIKRLLVDENLANRISKAGRKEAIRHFGKEMVYAAWKAYLGE